jgi:hypothetical protein
MKHLRLPLLALFGMAAFPQPAWANAGTPLMWAGMAHLVFGNALIGLGEGLLLAWVFSTPKLKTILTLILANYVSAWLGGLFIRASIVQALPLDLTNAWRWLWGMVVVTYFLTVLLEWPFIVWCLRDAKHWFRRSVVASLVAQSASYLLLFGWYWMASGTSLYTEMSIVEPADLSLPESVVVYFIHPTNNQVYRRPLVGGNEEKVKDLGPSNEYAQLVVQKSTADAGHWDLVARFETNDYNHPRDVDVLANMSLEAAPELYDLQDSTGNRRAWFTFGKAQRLGSVTDSDWEFWAGFWPVEGLQGSNKATGERVGFAYETPFGAWLVRHVTHLPSDKVLFQLGDDQICAFDPVRRQVALLWRGRSPVAVVLAAIPARAASAPASAPGSAGGRLRHKGLSQ